MSQDQNDSKELKRKRRRRRRIRKEIGLVVIAIGVVVLAVAIVLYASQLIKAYRAGNRAEEALAEVKEIMSGEIETDATEEEDDEETGTGVYYDYYGILSVPSMGIELPVLSYYSYDLLDVAPCRYMGTVEDKNLVIAGHNYARIFRPLKKAVPGETDIYFTDMDGNEYHYIVIRLETVEPTDIALMVGDSERDWDMTLFTCTTGGAARVAIRCVKVS